MNWFYLADGQRVGPVDDAALQRLVAEGKVGDATLVWHEGMAGWQPYGSARTEAAGGGARSETQVVTEAPQCAGAAARAVCCECGRTFPEEDVIRYSKASVCAECKPLFFQRVREGAWLPGVLVYAGFWTRALAEVIDWMITYVVNLIIAAFVMLLAGLAGGSLTGNRTALAIHMLGVVMATNIMQVAATAAYATWFVGTHGATPGKMACGLQVVRADGGRVSYGRALARFFAKMLSAVILYIGFVMVLFDDERRGLHDWLCDTRVVRK